MTAAHHLQVHSPVKSIDHWPICASEERELLLELSRLKIVFPLWWARAVMYPICVTLKTLNLKLKMSDRGCRRWWQLFINRANPSRRTSRTFYSTTTRRRRGSSRLWLWNRGRLMLFTALECLLLLCSVLCFSLDCLAASPIQPIYFADLMCLLDFSYV